MAQHEEQRQRDVNVAGEFLRRSPVGVGDDQFFPLEQFLVPHHYKDALKEIMIPHGLIVDRVEKLAQDIRHDYPGETIHLLCVLKGGSTYFQDLIAALGKRHDYSNLSYVPFTFDFIKVKSYTGTESSGRVQITGGDLEALRGKNILVVEDIIDTGLTMTSLVPVLKDHGAKSVRVTSLLEKRTHRSCGFKGDYVGFSIPDKFVIGYCLDYNEVFRDMQHIGVISEEGIERFKERDAR